MAEYPEILREYNYEETLDHVVEYPGAFRERDIGGGRILHEPDEGAVIQPGTPLSATFFNRKERAIWSLFQLYAELYGLYDAGFPEMADILARLRRLEDAVFNDITTNPFRVRFQTLDGITVSEGTWNEPAARLEV